MVTTIWNPWCQLLSIAIFPQLYDILTAGCSFVLVASYKILKVILAVDQSSNERFNSLWLPGNSQMTVKSCSIQFWPQLLHRKFTVIVPRMKNSFVRMLIKQIVPAMLPAFSLTFYTPRLNVLSHCQENF